VNAQLSRLHHELMPLAPALHEALSGAQQDTDANCELHDSPGRFWLRADLFRANLGDHLLECLPDAWILDQNERSSHRGALLVRGSDGYVEARIQRVASDGTLPEARTDLRRAFYDNEDLREVDLLGRCRHRLVVTYEEAHGQEGFTVRAIRPYALADGTYEIVMPRITESFETSRFRVVNEGSYRQLFGDESGGDAADL
jgi:hypothetical protein